MRGSALQNSIKKPVPAHLWPFKMDENCDTLEPPPCTSHAQLWHGTLQRLGNMCPRIICLRNIYSPLGIEKGLRSKHVGVSYTSELG
jgi:hypothetical protein